MKRREITVTLPNEWRPRGYELPLWRYLERGGRRAVPVWHRRSGKDDVCLNWTAVAAMGRVGNYWHMLPEATQARKAIWEAVNPHTGARRIDQAFPAGIRAATREQEMLVKFRNGSTWQVVGSDNYNSLVGSPPVGVVFSEYALADPNAWAFLRPILAENGGWAIFPSTPRGDNHLAALYRMARLDPTWFAEVLTVEDTGVIPLSVIEQERRELIAERGKDEAESIIQQEYYCSFSGSIPGSYYGHLIDAATKAGRITRVPYEPGVPVNTYWDLGIGDSTAIWFGQNVGLEPRFIGYYESHGVGLAHYVQHCQERGWLFGKHILPHDAGHKQLGDDQGRTLREILEALGLRPADVLERSDVEPGIEASRQLIQKAWFDADGCSHGLAALRHYRAKWDERNRVLQKTPLHDWSSHGADAFRTAAVGWVGKLRESPSLPARPRGGYVGGYNPAAGSWMGV